MGKIPEILTLGLAGFGIAVLAACSKDVKAADTPTIKVPPATATQEIPNSPIPESTPTIKPRPTSTEPPPTAIATGTATPKLPEATAISEAVKKPENILPEYSVFYGQMKEENGTGKGSVIIANIPGYPDKLYNFLIANRSGQGLLSVINKTDGNSLEAGNIGLKITLEDAETLSGRVEKFGLNSPVSWVFEIKYYGTGRAAAIEAAKKLWAKEVSNDPTLWNKVPEETILGAGFRKIELP